MSSITAMKKKWRDGPNTKYSKNIEVQMQSTKSMTTLQTNGGKKICITKTIWRLIITKQTKQSALTPLHMDLGVQLVKHSVLALARTVSAKGWKTGRLDIIDQLAIRSTLTFLNADRATC